MEREIMVTPEELYYLGEIMHAKYMDYSYIAAMKDIQKNYLLHESEARRGLSGRGMLEEDFSGNIQLSAEAISMLSPVFFGEFESGIAICSMKEMTMKNWNYHFQGENIVRVSIDHQKWRIQGYDAETILRDLENFLPKESKKTEHPVFDQGQINQIIVFKNILIGQESKVQVFFFCDGVLYSENKQQEVVYVTREQILEVAHQILIQQ